MRFALTDEQIALRDAVREVLARVCPAAASPSLGRRTSGLGWAAASPSLGRRTSGLGWAGGAGGERAVDRVWAVLVELGVVGMAVPEQYGGLGLSDVDLVPVLIEVGAAAVPLPVAETAAVAAPLLTAAGDPGGLVPRIVAGESRVALRLGAGPVPYAGRSDLVLDLAGPAARIGPAAGAELSTVDGSRAARAGGAEGAIVTTDPDLIAHARDRAAVATAAQLVGLSRRMLDMTVAYVRSRQQFGVAVGSFQAVKHWLADALRHIEFAEPVVLAAAWASSTGSPDRGRDVSAAVIPAVDAARFVARAAIQCHGAMGYTVEYDLHLYAKRAWALAATCDLDAHLDRIAGALDLPPEGVLA